MSNIKFPGIDKQVLLRIEEAIKKDVSEFHQANGRDVTFKKDDDTFVDDEVMRNGQGVFLSAIKQERTEHAFDLRNQVDVQGNFLNDINFNQVSPIMPPKADLSHFNAFEHNMNLTMEMQRLVNEQLRMEDYQEDMPLAQDQHFDIPMDFEDAPMQAGEGLFQLENDFADAVAAPAKRAMKKQVHAIRSAMMKHDKKTQKNYGAAHAQNAAEDDDDIVRNMTNLILNNKAAEDSHKPWEKGLLEASTHFTSKPAEKKRRPLLGNFSGKEDSKFNMFLNPQVESFLSFTIENNQTALQTHLNATALTGAGGQQTNLFDQTMFTGLINNNGDDN